jgi:hypothetical protein
MKNTHRLPFFNKRFKFNLAAILLVLFCFDTSITEAAIRTATTSGAWTNASIWSPSVVPVCGDTIVVNSSITVSVTSQLNYSGCSDSIVLIVNGILYFEGGNKLRLPCGSKLYVMPGGALDSDGAGNSNQLELCGSTEWSGSQGTYAGPSCIPATLPGCESFILPVSLSAINLAVCENEVCLEWQTSSETGNSHFNIERSADGHHYSIVSKMSSKSPNGYSVSKLNYNWRDMEPLRGVSYYRLRQVDLDGRFAYSRIMAVDLRLKVNGGFSVFPNPGNGRFTVKTREIPEGSNMVMQIRTMPGLVVYSREWISNGSEFEVEAEGLLNAGAYIVSINAGGKNHVVRLLVNYTSHGINFRTEN